MITSHSSFLLVGLFLLPLTFLEGQETPRAIPLNPDGTPSNIPRAAPVAPAQDATDVTREEPKKAKPSSPDQDLFTYANILFQRREYDIAIAQYQKYKQVFPRGQNIDGVNYRLGECYLKLAYKEQALRQFKLVANTATDREFSSPASYRLGSYYLKNKNYTQAVKYFQKAKKTAIKEKISLSSSFYSAVSYQYLDQLEKAIASYNEVIKTKEKNPYLEHSLRDLSSIHARRKEPKLALLALENLAEDTSSEEIRAEAIAKSGILLSNQTDNESSAEDAKKYLTQLKDIRARGKWRANGLYTLTRILESEKNWDEVIEVSNKIRVSDLPAELRPNLLLITGDAHRKKGHYLNALEEYRTLEKHHSSSREASQSGYSKLICLYKLKDRDLPKLVTQFVKKEQKIDAESPLISKAKLLEAESHFQNGKYKAAAQAYALVKRQHVPVELLPSLLYNKGWCEHTIGNPSASDRTLTIFLENFKDNKMVPQVLATRLLARRDKGDNKLALEDATTIIKNHSELPISEIAYQQSGLIHGEFKDWEKSVSSFNELRKKYPKSVAIPEAHFYSGKAFFEQKKYQEATTHFKKAIELDRESYLDIASLRIILCYYFLEKPTELAESINQYLEVRPDANIDPKIYTWLGAQLYEQKNYIGAEKYLTLSVEKTAEEEVINSNIWRFLAESRLALKKYDGAESAISNYIQNTYRTSNKARGYLIQSKARLGKNDFESAQESVFEGLALQKEGGLAGELNIQVGEIALREGDDKFKNGDQFTAKQKYEEAVAKFTVVSQILYDPQITPLALKRTADVYRRLGEDDKAKRALTELATKFPNYKL